MTDWFISWIPSPWWGGLVLSLDYLIKVVAVGVVPENRRPSSSSAWLLLILLVPVVGIPLFLLLGSSYLRGRRTEIQSDANHLLAKQSHHLPTIPRGVEVDANLQSILELNRRLTSMPCAMGRNFGIEADTNVTLRNMADAVDSAKNYIHVEFYAMSWDDATDPFFLALVRASTRGVRVRVLMDHLGTVRYRGSRHMRRKLTQAGIQWYVMLPINPFVGRFRRPDLRNHRKILVIDGVRGFVGSQNMIEPAYRNPKNRRIGRLWYDTTMELRGPIVAQLDAIFAVDWYSESSEVIDVLETGASMEDCTHGDGANVFQVVPSGPGFDTDPNLRMFTSLVHLATSRLILVSPYFVPDESLLAAVTTAAYRGVEVELFVPEKADQFMVHHAQRSYFRALLKSGVRIHRYPAPKVLHSKFLVVDDRVAVMGSSNMDMRSFLLNFEVSVIAFDGDALYDLLRIAAQYRTRSEELTLEEWQKRPWLAKYVDNVFRLTSALQ